MIAFPCGKGSANHDPGSHLTVQQRKFFHEPERQDVCRDRLGASGVQPGDGISDRGFRLGGAAGRSSPGPAAAGSAGGDLRGGVGTATGVASGAACGRSVPQASSGPPRAERGGSADVGAASAGVEDVPRSGPGDFLPAGEGCRQAGDIGLHRGVLSGGHDRWRATGPPAVSLPDAVVGLCLCRAGSGRGEFPGSVGGIGACAAGTRWGPGRAPHRQHVGGVLQSRGGCDGGSDHALSGSVRGVRNGTDAEQPRRRP